MTAPEIAPGFQGTITLETANFGTVPVDLRPVVDEPAQLLLLGTADRAEARRRRDEVLRRYAEAPD